jgi:hypothetical protein
MDQHLLQESSPVLFVIDQALHPPERESRLFAAVKSILPPYRDGGPQLVQS